MSPLLHALRRRLGPGQDGNTESKGGTLSISSFTLIIFVSALLYLLMQVYVQRKLRLLHSMRRDLDTKKLLLMSLWVACFVRVMTFVGLGALSIANVNVNYAMKDGGSSSEGKSEDDDTLSSYQDFYDKSVNVLFDLPDYIIVSTYVLLTMVWAECFLHSRFHTLDSANFRRMWLIGYMVFNALIYGGQLFMYTILFVTPGSSQQLRNLMFLIVTCINFLVVFTFFLLFLYMNFKFSGFPFKSPSARKSFGKIGTVIFYWSCARLIWAAADLFAYVNEVSFVSADYDQSVWSLVLISLFIACELGPMFVTLDYSLLSIMELSHGNASGYRNVRQTDDIEPGPQSEMYDPLPDTDAH